MRFIDGKIVAPPISTSVSCNIKVNEENQNRYIEFDSIIFYFMCFCIKNCLIKLNLDSTVQQDSKNIPTYFPFNFIDIKFSRLIAALA